jgi:hypothetical protein
LQHAIARGLEIVYQLEEGEIQTEPVPARDNRRGILAFEASEGGAGVLGRLTTDPNALVHVARAALELMHYRNLDAAIGTADPKQLLENDDARCVKGCYRCLLSYFNQPDHEHIDRTNDVVRALLLRLARSKVAINAPLKSGAPRGAWHAALVSWGLPSPDLEPLTVNGANLPLAWRSHLVAAAIGAVDPDTRAGAESLGFTIAILPAAPGEKPPVELAKLLGLTE